MPPTPPEAAAIMIVEFFILKIGRYVNEKFKSLLDEEEEEEEA